MLEIVTDHVGNTFRAVYTVKFARAIYVLHAFQKKSKSGFKTPTEELELIKQRLKSAESEAADRTQQSAVDLSFIHAVRILQRRMPLVGAIPP